MEHDRDEHSLSSAHVLQIEESDNPLDEFAEVILELIYSGDAEDMYDVPGHLSEDDLDHTCDSKCSTREGDELTVVCEITGTSLEHGGGCPDMPRTNRYRSKRIFTHTIGENFYRAVSDDQDADDFYPDEYY